jgi:hypothetical protein
MATAACISCRPIDLNQQEYKQALINSEQSCSSIWNLGMLVAKSRNVVKGMSTPEDANKQSHNNPFRKPSADAKAIESNFCRGLILLNAERSPIVRRDSAMTLERCDPSSLVNRRGSDGIG